MVRDVYFNRNSLDMCKFFHKLGSPPWFYSIAGRILRWLLPITLFLLMVGCAWGLLFTAPDFRQGNSYRIMYVHVPAAVVALAGYYVMAIAGVICIVWNMKMAEIAIRATAPVGALLTLIALVTGAIWGKPTWGAWWVWDARTTSMLILFFLYIGVIALYEAYEDKSIASRAAGILALVGTVNITIIYKSVDWWYSLHQPASITFTGGSAIESSMLYPLLLMITAFYLLFTCCVLRNMRENLIKREWRSSWVRTLVEED